MDGESCVLGFSITVSVGEGGRRGGGEEGRGAVIFYHYSEVLLIER